MSTKQIALTKVSNELYTSEYYMRGEKANKYIQFSKIGRGKWEYAVICEYQGDKFSPYVVKSKVFDSLEEAVKKSSLNHPHLCH